MAFLNSIWLWGPLAAAGVAVPIIIHLLNRLQKRHTKWGAMDLLKRAVVVRTKQMRLEDVLILVLRCLGLALLAMAMARPTIQTPSGGWVGGEKRTGVVVALDASFSMGHGQHKPRMNQAVSRVKDVLSTVSPGDPVTLVLMGNRTRVLLRNAGYDKDKFDAVLAGVGGDAPAGSGSPSSVEPLPEALNVSRCLHEVHDLLAEMTKTPSRECYIVSDAQMSSWGAGGTLPGDSWQTLKDISSLASVFFVPLDSDGDDNVSVSKLQFLRGTLRRNGTARFAAEVRNNGSLPARNVVATFVVNNLPVARQEIDSLAPGEAKAVDFVAGFPNAGDARLCVQLGKDSLPADNSAYGVVRIPQGVRVLCAFDGDAGWGAAAAQYISKAIAPKLSTADDRPLTLVVLSAQDMVNEKLSDYDVVLLSNVGAMDAEQGKRLVQFVRDGGGLIVFVGDRETPSLYNEQAGLWLDGEFLLPGALGEIVRMPESQSEGWAVEPVAGTHPLSRAVSEAVVPAELLDELRVWQYVSVRLGAQSQAILNVATARGGTSPESQPGASALLSARSLGRGEVLLFAAPADRRWTNLPMHPLMPILLQQALAYLTGGAQQASFVAGGELPAPIDSRASLRAASGGSPESIDGPKVIIRDPGGRESAVAVSTRGGQRVVSGQAGPPGYYELRQEGDQAPMAVFAVNVDERESNVRMLGSDGLRALLPPGVKLAPLGQGELLGLIRESRIGYELSKTLLVAAVAVLLLQSVLARYFSRRLRRRDREVERASTAATAL